jgi:hypothetical protein
VKIFFLTGRSFCVDFLDVAKDASSKEPVISTILPEAVELFEPNAEGRGKYWRRSPDKSRWGEKEHYMKFIVHIVGVNQWNGEILAQKSEWDVGNSRPKLIKEEGLYQ